MGKISAEMNPAKPDVTEKIKEDIRRTEATITDTLHTIEHRFTPAHIKSEMKAKIRRYALTALVKTDEAIRRKNVRRALLGAGAALLALKKFRKREKRRSVAETGSRLVEALPERIKRSPSEGIKHYLTVGRLVFAIASAVGTALLRQKKGVAPSAEPPWQYTPTPRVYHGGIHGNVME